MNSLRILYTIPFYKPAYAAGGPIFSISAAAETLVSRGHKVVIFTTNSNGVENLDVPVNKPIMMDGVEVWYFEKSEPLKRLFPFIKYLSQSMGYYYSLKMTRAVNQKINEFDIVHTHAVWVYPTLVAGRAAIKSGVPFFYHQRGDFNPERLRYRSLKKRFYLQAFVRPIINRATMLIALNDAERKYYQDLGFNRPCRVIPNGIDIKLYRQKPVDNYFGNLPIRSDQLVILFMSRMHVFKGADIQVNAFLRIAHKFPNAVLFMAGPDEQNITENLKQHVRNAGMYDRVFFPGMISGTLKKNLLARANLFCLPSLGEGFSMAILEAMASATPVMISPGCNFPDILKYRAGMVVKRDIVQWAEALEKFIIDRKSQMEMGENAFFLVKNSYTWDKIVEQLEIAYCNGIDNMKNNCEL